MFSFEASPRARGSDSRDRRAYESPFKDRHVSSRPPPPDSLVPSTAGAPQPRKQKNGLFMMSFGSGSGKRSSSGQSGNAFAQTEAAILKGPKNNRLTPSAAPTLNFGGRGRGSIPASSSGAINGAGNAVSNRMSSASISRRGSTSEYDHFHESWQSLSSVKGDGSSKDGRPYRINVLPWNLDPSVQELRIKDIADGKQR
jgi:hypothetical protein